MELLTTTLYWPKDSQKILELGPSIQELEDTTYKTHFSNYPTDSTCYLYPTDVIKRITNLYPACIIPLILDKQAFEKNKKLKVLAYTVIVDKKIQVSGNLFTWYFGYLQRTEPTFRGQGLARELFAELARHSQPDQQRFVHGYVRAENKESLAMLKASNFKMWGEHTLAVFAVQKNLEIPQIENVSATEMDSVLQSNYMNHECVYIPSSMQILQHPCCVLRAKMQISKTTSVFATVFQFPWIELVYNKSHHSTLFIYNLIVAGLERGSSLALPELERFYFGVAQKFKCDYIIVDIEQKDPHLGVLLGSQNLVSCDTELYDGINYPNNIQQYKARMIDPLDQSSFLFFHPPTPSSRL